MIITSLILPAKVVTAIAKEMLSSELSKRISTGLASAGRHLLFGPEPERDGVKCDDECEANTEKLNSETLGGSAASHNKNQASTEYLVYNWLEASFAWLQMVILWHDPVFSLGAIAVMFTSFFLLTFVAPRFYATIMIILFVNHFVRVWFRYVWPEIRVPPRGGDDDSRLDVDRFTYLHPQVMTLKELCDEVRKFSQNMESSVAALLALRRERPIVFCSIICTILSCTAYIGNRVNGATLLLCAMTATITLPGIYLRVLPEAARTQAKLVALSLLHLPAAIVSRLNDPDYFADSDEEEESDDDDDEEEDKICQCDATGSQPTQGISESEPITYPDLTMISPISIFGSMKRLVSKTTDSITSDRLRESDESHHDDDALTTQSSAQTGDKKECSNTATERKLSEDLSSNESTSVIDYDEEQQDGFVML